MYRHYFILSSVLLLFTVTAHAETFETIRQQFEIYQRFAGELEILSGDNVHEIDNVLKRTEEKRLTVRQALDNIHTEDKPKRDLPSPLFSESFTAPFFHYVTLERVVAQRAIQQGKPDATMQSLQYVYRLTDALADSESLKLRITAAQIRLQMLETVQSFLSSPHCRHEHHEQLHQIFDALVNRRPTDGTIWALYLDEGKRFFEAISRRGLEEMVAPKMLKELEERRALNGYAKSAVERFTHDQSAFQRIMPIVIESCSVPFFKRSPMLRQLDDELRNRQGTETEPVFTILLLRDATETMRLLTQEQSGNEMAYLALSASLGNQERRKVLNFLTGNEYKFPLIMNGIACTYDGNIKPFYVPYRHVIGNE